MMSRPITIRRCFWWASEWVLEVTQSTDKALINRRGTIDFGIKLTQINHTLDLPA